MSKLNQKIHEWMSYRNCWHQWLPCVTGYWCKKCDSKVPNRRVNPSYTSRWKDSGVLLEHLTNNTPYPIMPCYNRHTRSWAVIVGDIHEDRGIGEAPTFPMALARAVGELIDKENV